MDNFKFYRVNLDYIKYLWNFDRKVQYNEKASVEYNEKRPYVGIILRKNEHDYFVPLEHPRPEHQNLKENIHILKINNGRYGLIAFNNMVLIDKDQLIGFDFKDEDTKYKNILVSQFVFCQKHKREIYEHADGTYDICC